ncbi:MAG TPA: hypothetical protein VK588_03625 [Chitinophagaceae bacterium]|nr:hypothetical protein [Chitinophagaceae bacterium]
MTLISFSLLLHAQNIHGLWTGTLINDSTHRSQDFELGLSEYRGKITGYTFTTFIDNDTFYYSIKRVKGQRKDGKLVLEDDEMVGNNFPERAAKHVKQITVFPLINDSTIDISNGRWTTNQTKRFYAIGGSATIKKQENQSRSDLLAHLQEANVKTDLASNQDENKQNRTVAAGTSEKKPVQNSSVNTSENKKDVAKNPVIPPPKLKPTSETSLKPADENKAANEDKKETVVSEKENGNKDPDKNTKQIEVVNNPVSSQNAKGNENKNNTGNTIIQNQTSQIKPTEKNDKTKDQIIQIKDQPANNVAVKEKSFDTVSKSAAVIPKKEVMRGSTELPDVVAGRINEKIQDIYFKSDSLVLSLYDNGIVDGDTVSVFVNGENVVSKQKLKEVATKKTIFISEGTDSVQLILFAENLGTIPPNTGLLIIRDGDDTYQVHFSADLQQNASVTLRRRRK